MRRRLLGATVAGLAAAVLTACGNLHPGAAIVVNDGDYRVSMSDLDELTTALCEASPILAQAQGQGGQVSEGINVRQYVADLLIQSYLSPLAAKKVGANEPTPDELAVSEDRYSQITNQMDENTAADFVRLLKIGNAVAVWQAKIGVQLPGSTPSTAGTQGHRYVLRFGKNFNIDIDPRLGLSGDDLLAAAAKSGSVSVAQSVQATARENSSQSADVAAGLPPTQTCG